MSLSKLWPFMYSEVPNCRSPTLIFWRKISRPYALIRDPTVIFQNICQSLKIVQSKLHFPQQQFLFSYPLYLFLVHL